jgi:hypothetical protein
LNPENDRLVFYLWLFGVLFAYFQIMPAFLIGFAWNSLTWGDIHDFLTPFIIVPCVYFLYLSIQNQRHETIPSRFARTIAGPVLALGMLLYVNGHGLHLSANAIARVIGSLKDSEVYQTVYLFDEIISHTFWDAGVFLISIGLILLARGIFTYEMTRSNVILLAMGAVFYGFCFTVNGIEGQTVIFTMPAACVGAVITFSDVRKNRRTKKHNPVQLFFLLAYSLSLILFAYWGITHRGFPQFSDLGMI